MPRQLKRYLNPTQLRGRFRNRTTVNRRTFNRNHGAIRHRHLTLYQLGILSTVQRQNRRINRQLAHNRQLNINMHRHTVSINIIIKRAIIRLPRQMQSQRGTHLNIRRRRMNITSFLPFRANTLQRSNMPILSRQNATRTVGQQSRLIRRALRPLPDILERVILTSLFITTRMVSTTNRHRMRRTMTSTRHMVIVNFRRTRHFTRHAIRRRVVINNRRRMQNNRSLSTRNRFKLRTPVNSLQRVIVVSHQGITLKAFAQQIRRRRFTERVAMMLRHPTRRRQTIINSRRRHRRFARKRHQLRNLKGHACDRFRISVIAKVGHYQQHSEHDIRQSYT